MDWEEKKVHQKRIMDQLLKNYDFELLEARSSTPSKQYSIERALLNFMMAFKDRWPVIVSDDDAAYMHKAFRQVDILESGELDMVAWHLLNEAEVFWDVLRSTRQKLGYTEAASKEAE